MAKENTSMLFSMYKSIGSITTENPNFKGFLDLYDILNENNSQVFTYVCGKFIRKSLYTDIGTKKSCGILSYIKFAIVSGPFWITDDVLRIYYDNQFGSVTEGGLLKKAFETVKCYRSLFKNYEHLYIIHAPHVLKLKKLKLSVYIRLARQKGYWSEYIKGVSFSNWKETLAVGLMLLAGINASSMFAKLAKKIGLIRRYG